MTENKSLKKAEDTILDSIADGVFTVDHDWRITSFNRAAEKITGVPHEEAIGQQCRDVLKAEVCEKSCCLRKTMASGDPIINETVYIVNASGRRLPISISTALLRNDAGSVMGAVETFRDISIEEKLRKTIEAKYSFEDIISRNHRMHQLFDILPDIAESTSTVLIEGESGTGKELFARAIHNLSARKNKPFIIVNCGALPDTLLESELFGYKAGAFTDAKKDKPGRFKLADKGTLFLDEIGDISPALQIRLLRILQEKTYEPLGSVETLKADVRIIAATNKRLADQVKAGKFREDLYYRINVMRLELPPLRERMEDVPLLVDHFIRHFNALQNKEISGISETALACLMSYDFPGNIRELENILERAFIMCKSGMIEPHHLPEFLNPRKEENGAIRSVESMSIKDMEAIFLTNALKKNNWSRMETARQLGIHKSTLFRKIKALHIQIPNMK
ncbi:MAG: sigma 54-interacting transcriptional regulator [Deltaproteobacteria bacterium]|nr:sigma 54-interacting transcriptional regulator [Deltaproteobacteria bacterium]